ncbi:hypothetical protein AB3329_01850 [Streptococcus sp. H31]|uniref:hypothetical protein n=1 Tax=Streptococcus huangxiaojuni TaxID=3237239 RepID=UPI0034A23EBC
MNKEEKNALTKQLKQTVSELGESLQANDFEAAYELANSLQKQVENDEFMSLTGKELADLQFEDIKKTLKRYWYNNRQMRMFQGGLRKNGATFVDLVK